MKEGDGEGLVIEIKTAWKLILMPMVTQNY